MFENRHKTSNWLYIFEKLSFSDKTLRSVKFLIRIIYIGRFSFESLELPKPRLKTTNYMSKIREVLDCAIGNYEGKEGGYRGKNGKIYPNYMSNEEWEEYHKTIPDDIQEKLMKEIQGEPPKMASFGSSCRMAFDMLNSIPDIDFEKILSTKVSTGRANLDAYVKRGAREIFTEAKRGEIYDSHLNVEINEKYLEVYKKLNKFFSFTTTASSKERYVKCTFKAKDKEIIHFDLKQLICHFLGITAGVLEGRITAEKIRFVYLIYNPNEIKDCIDNKYRDKILKQYKETLEEIELFDMKELFAAVFKVQKEKLQINRNIKDGLGVECDFEFILADQNNCADLFKE